MHSIIIHIPHLLKILKYLRTSAKPYLIWGQLLRNVYPKTIAQQLVSVQPMGLEISDELKTYYEKLKYESLIKSDSDDKDNTTNTKTD